MQHDSRTATTSNRVLQIAVIIVLILFVWRLRSGSSADVIWRRQADLPDGWRWDKYHTHAEVVDFLHWINSTYSHVAHLQVIGTSVLGKELLAIRLSDRSKASASTPSVHGRIQVKLVGGIHGNEQACPELLLRLVHHLARGYGASRRITQLLGHTDVYVLPAMNPDGRELDTRHNAAGKDLNRNFPLDPLPFDAPGPPLPSDSETVQSWRKVGAGPPEPEVAAVMAWSRAHDFALSASLHQGALVANYPFDSCDTQGLTRSCPTPDDPLPVFLARAYAINHPEMRHNTNASEGFQDGTVQGARWYTLLGGMQDWVFWERQSLELTLELNPIMKPPAQEVESSMWQNNLPALMRFLELAHLRLQARVLDMHTHKPLAGIVEVAAPLKHRPLNITQPSGTFSMMLAPDTVYCLIIHPINPRNVHATYHTIHVAVLRLGGATFMQGKGLRDLTVSAEVLAAPVPTRNMLADSSGSQAPSSAAQFRSSPPGAIRRLMPAGGGQDDSTTQGNTRQVPVVVLGHATPDMCWFDGAAQQM